MAHSLSQLNRFFVSPQFSIYYRQLRRLQWANEAPNHYAVLSLLQGNLNYQVHERANEMHQGQSLLMEPFVSVSASGQDLELLLLTLSPSFVVDYAVRMHLVAPGATITFPVRLIAEDERAGQLARSLSEELAEKSAGREIVVTALVDQVVVHLLRNYANMRLSDELELSRVGLIDRRIRRAVELMHAQLYRDLSLMEVANASHLSPFHFARLFKKLTGATPHTYLARLRTARAQSLLAETDLSISEICSQVGYSSPSHFTKAFRQATGLTPRGFRNALVSR